MIGDENPSGAGSGTLERVRRSTDAAQDRVRRLLLWGVWERMLETEFVDRSVALAGKAFVSFFPLTIVVAAFVPPSVRADDLRNPHDSPRRAR